MMLLRVSCALDARHWRRPLEGKVVHVATEGSGALSGTRILIVEDEAMIALLLQNMVTDLGCIVAAWAKSTVEALAFISTGEAFDAALLDLLLNGETALPIAAALDQRGIPFVVTTGFDGPVVLSRFAGHVILQKPIEQTDLERALVSLKKV